jgi:hypothetical protein
MTRYYRTDSSHGFTEDDALVFPDEWTEITAQEYDALIAAEQQAADDAAAAVLAAANTRWTTVHDDLLRIGASADSAVLLANAVGIPPA